MTLSITVLSAKCHYAEWRVFHCYAECHYAEYCYAVCFYAECRGELEVKFLVFEHSSLMLKLAFSDVPLLEFDSQCCQ
jgi:hypothetical protein